MAIYDDQGQIQVKAGDSISKYHMAIYGNFGNQDTWSVFGRPPLQAGGDARTIDNYNLIYTGETILYLPVWKKKRTPGIVIGVPAPGPLTDEELQNLITRLNLEAGLNHNLAEQYAYKLLKWIDGHGNHAADQLDLVEKAIRYVKFAKDIGGSIQTGLTGPPATFLGAFGFQVTGLFAWLNARKQGLRYVSLRAVAYGVTSWTWGDPPPQYPLSLRGNLSAGPVTDPTLTVADFEKEWNTTVQKVRTAMDGLEAERNTEKPCIQTSLAFTVAGPKELCEKVMTYMETKYLSESMLPFLPPYVRGSVHDAFWSPKPDYPN